MSVEFKRVKPKNIRSVSDTAGGTTYYVKLPNEREEKAICFRRSKRDQSLRCTMDAGYGTWHAGTGACKHHGGSTSINPTMVSGKHARVTRERLNNSIQDYLNGDRTKLLDLSYQLAVAKAIFDEMIESFPEATDETYGIWLHRFQESVGTLGNLVEKISRVDNRNTLTSAQVLYLRATIADILMKYLPNPSQREKAVKELADRMGGDIEVELGAVEVYDGVVVR